MTDNINEDSDIDRDVVDDDEHANPNQEDIGTFDPGDTEDEDYGAEVDDLPEVGEPDPNEAPILDELDEEESNG